MCWISFTSEDPSLSLLVRRLEEAFELLSIPAEHRPFHPHVTIARSRRDFEESASLRRALSLIEPAPLVQEISALTLFSSELGGSGSMYIRQGTFELGRNL